MYRAQEPIACLTAHDYPSSLMAQRAGVDVVLVGDSLGMVALGYESTQQVTLADMIHHAKAVGRAHVASSMIVVDLPFGSYEASPAHALASAVQVMQQTAAGAVKLEGGAERADTIRTLVAAGIPVMGHIGLLPQRSNTLGGFRVQGKTMQSVSADWGGANLTQALKLLDDAVAVEASGAFAIVVEAVPDAVTRVLSGRLRVPLIGIGAGNAGCSGQVLVQNDVLGVYDQFVPRFVRQYAQMGELQREAIAQYVRDVKSREFPAHENMYPMPEEQVAEMQTALQHRE